MIKFPLLRAPILCPSCVPAEKYDERSIYLSIMGETSFQINRPQGIISLKQLVAVAKQIAIPMLIIVRLMDIFLPHVVGLFYFRVSGANFKMRVVRS